MATLEYNITGTVNGLSGAANAATGILRNLKQTADNLKIDLLGATSKQNIDAIGGALTIVTGKIKEYTQSAIQGSQAFKDQQASAALDTLSTKISVLLGNSQLFGQSISNQQAQVKAYSDTINVLLKNGFDPLDSRVQSLKSNIDRLTISIEQQKSAARTIVDPFAKYKESGALIQDAQNKINRLQDSLKNATSERSIAQYNIRLREAQSEFTRLNSIATQNNGLIAQAERKVYDLGNALRSATTKTGIKQISDDLRKAQVELSVLNSLSNRARGGFNSVGVEFGRIIQDAPFAANNFGAIGNNITRLVEIIPGYITQTRAIIVANGGVATSANVAKQAIGGLFTGFGGISLAISALVAGFVIYQQVQQANARKAAEHTDAIQKQKQALDDYIGTLDIASKVSAKAASEYATEATKLDILYQSLKNNSEARYGNISALEELQKSWPEEFGNLKKGVGFVDNLSASYRALKDNILQTGIAAAAQSLSADATKKLVENTVALQGAVKDVADAQAEYNKKLDEYNKLRFAPNRGGAAGGGAGTSELNDASAAMGAAKNNLIAAKDAAATFRIEAFKARQEISKFDKAAIDAQNRIKTPVKSGLLYDLERELQRLQSIRPTIKVKTELDLNTKAIADIQKKIDDLNGKKEKGPSGPENTFKSLSDTLDGLLRKLEAFTNESGLQGYALEVQKITDKYIGLNAEIDKTLQKGSADKAKGKISQSQLDELNSKGAIDREAAALAKRIELFDAEIAEKQRVANEIERINNHAGIQTAESRDKELAQIKAFYDKEEKLARDNEEILAALRAGRAKEIADVNQKYIDKAVADFNKLFTDANEKINKKSEKSESDLSNVISRSLRNFGQSFIETLSSVETYSKGTFASIFSDLTNQLSTSLNKVFQDVVLNGLSKALSSAISSGTSGLISSNGKITGLGAGVAAAGVIGGTISAATPKTSSGGQALGGALSGAASGAVLGSVVPGIGTAVGAVVGGLIGGVSGLLSASSARKKEEELSKSQLEELKKQTELLRQAQAAYTSQIIGRMTANGTITGINVGSTGQLIATVSGSDLQFVLDRNGKSR